MNHMILSYLLILLSLCLCLSAVSGTPGVVSIFQGWNEVECVAYESTGNFLICDTANNRVLRISSGNAVLNVMGVGSLEEPNGIALDTSGNIYVSHVEGVTVMNNAGNVLNTFAAFGSMNATEAMAIGIDTTSGYLYVAVDHYILKATTSGGLISPYDLSAIIPHVEEIEGLAVSGGILYFSDTDNGRVVLIDATGGFSYWNVTSYIEEPTGLVIDSSSNVYVADGEGTTVVKFNSAGTYQQTFTTSNPSLNDPHGLALNANGNLLVADEGNARVVQFTPIGSVIGILSSSIPTIDEPTGIAVDSSGNIYIVNEGADSILVLNSAGNLLHNFTASFDAPFGIALTSSSIWVSDTDNHRLVQLNMQTGGVMSSITTNLEEPTGIAIDSNGYIYVADEEADAIVKFSSSGSYTSSFTTSNPSLDAPEGVAVDNSGNIYIADTGNNRIVVLSSSGSQTNSFTANFDEPHAIAIGSSGNIYVADTDSNRIVVLTSSGSVSNTYTVSSTPGLTEPEGLYLDSQGMMYIADTGNNRVIVYNTNSGVTNRAVHSGMAAIAIALVVMVLVL